MQHFQSICLSLNILHDSFGSDKITKIYKKFYGDELSVRNGRAELRGHNGRRVVTGSIDLLNIFIIFTLTDTEELEVKSSNLEVISGIKKVKFIPNIITQVPLLHIIINVYVYK